MDIKKRKSVLTKLIKLADKLDEQKLNELILFAQDINKTTIIVKEIDDSGYSSREYEERFKCHV